MSAGRGAKECHGEKGKKVLKTKGNQEKFEAMKKKTKNLLIGVVATMVLAVIGVVIYKARQ